MILQTKEPNKAWAPLAWPLAGLVLNDQISCAQPAKQSEALWPTHVTPQLRDEIV